MSDTAAVEIARATRADQPALSAALAKAFEDDPVFAWIVADRDQRRARLPTVFGAFAEVYLPHGETYLTGDGSGGAMWAPPGVEPFGEAHVERFAEQMVEALGGDAERAFQLDELLDTHHPDEPCFYLQFVGVVPDRQGSGLGSRLLTAVLDRCDATGTPAYLDATSPDNRRLYERHGFAVVGQVTLPDGPSLWSMWREPVDQGA